MLIQRGAILLAATLGITLATALPALADGPVVTGGGRKIGTQVVVGGTSGSGAPGAGGTSSPGGGGSGVKCLYHYLPGFDSPGPPPTKAYDFQCDNGTSGRVQAPAGALPGAAPRVTPGQLAQKAFNEMVLPKPAVQLSPPNGAGRFQLVNFPTWWWVTNFTPMRQRTALGPVWAEVTATPLSSVFDGGEGAGDVRCDGAGLAWRSGLSGDYPGACSYSYRHAANSVTATVKVTWQVTWVGSGGAGGELPRMQLAAALPLTVYERQAVNVRYGS